MGAVMPFDFFTLLDSILIVGGHGDSITGRSYPSGGSDGGDDGGGIGTAVIVAVLVLTAATVALLAWLNRQEKGSDSEHRVRALKLRSIAPAGLIAAIIATPLIVWTASSGGDDEKSLVVERWTNDSGDPELIVSLTEEDLNTLETTDGKRTVSLRCLGRQGQTVLDTTPKWPFINEAGYEYPHAHQPATAEQVQRADSCRLRADDLSLEADVEGALTG
jgi:hypothetical protein